MRAFGNLIIKIGRKLGGRVALPVAELAIAATSGVIVGLVGYHIMPKGSASVTVSSTGSTEAAPEAAPVVEAPVAAKAEL